MLEIWTKNGKIKIDNTSKVPWRELHREDGPAYIVYTENFMSKEISLYAEFYYENGKLHRNDGPAEIHYNKNGITEFYYLDNNKYSKIKWEFLIKNNMSGRDYEWTDDQKMMFRLLFQ